MQTVQGGSFIQENGIRQIFEKNGSAVSRINEPAVVYAIALGNKTCELIIFLR